jgi:hypothetical protein
MSDEIEEAYPELTFERWEEEFPRIAAKLNEMPQVRWDRFVTYQNVTRVFGWIDREDGRADFVLCDFYSNMGDPTILTSDPCFHPALEQDGFEWEPCRRVEEFMSGVEQAIRLTPPTESPIEDTPVPLESADPES